MSDEEQRIAIAEACGYQNCEGEAGQTPWDGQWDTIPDYLNDLNAMHEAVKALNLEQQCDFMEHIEQALREPENLAFGDKPTKKFKFNHWGRFDVCNATARQRAEAFLRTIGKWKEGVAA